LMAKFPLGGSADATGYTAPDGSVLYCLGPQGQPDEKFGHIWAEIAWKGILSSPTLDGLGVTQMSTGDYAKGVSLAMTTQETMWPQEKDGNTIALGTPYAPNPPFRTLTIPAPGGGFIVTAQLPWRVRLIGRAYTASIKGITIGSRTAITRPPKCTIPDPTILDGNINWNQLPDPLVTWSKDTGTGDGWVCRNYQRSSEYAVGEKVLAFWNADYEWVERYGP